MPKKYFPTKEFCSCPLDQLDPKEIKNLYSRELKKDDIQPNRYYNLTAKTFGFQDWSEYLSAYENDLLPFLKSNGLIHYAPDNGKNILSSNDISFTYRQVSDRLFLSNREIPQALFTGYKCQTDYLIHYIPDIIMKEVPDSFFPIQEIPDEYLYQREAYFKFLSSTQFDLLIPLLASEFFSLKNLLGDLFIKNKSIDEDQFVATLYTENEGLIEQNEYIQKARAFKNILLKMNKGWIEIIPFNDNLIFLKAEDGTYDFVFKNMREHPFTSPYGKHIKHRHIPALLNENYDFSRWNYFGFKEQKKKLKHVEMKLLWKERDEHLSEISFYKEHGLKEYPGSLHILKSYYSELGEYTYKRRMTTKIMPDFNLIDLGESTLYVSQLITIKEFSKFYEADYLQDRSKTLENLESVNIENKGTPVSVIWYDAIAYCQWLAKENDYMPFRLLTKKEFDLITSTVTGDGSRHNLAEELLFYYKNKKLPSPPPYMGDFENVYMKNAKPYQYIEQNSLKFPTSPIFREWANDYNYDLAETFSVKTKGNPTIDTKYLASSTNKYKYRKIGFRVCYEVQKDLPC